MDSLAENMMFRLVFKSNWAVKSLMVPHEQEGDVLCYLSVVLLMFEHMAIVGFSCIGDGWSDFLHYVTTPPSTEW